MEQTTDTAPAVRPEARVAPVAETPESEQVDPLDNVRAATWSGDGQLNFSPAFASTSGIDQRNLQMAGFTDTGEMPYFNTGDLYKTALSTGENFSANPGDNVQLASLRTGEERQNDKVKPSQDTAVRLGGMLDGLTKGDYTAVQQYLKDMNNPADPKMQQDLQAGMKMFTDYLTKSGIDAKVVMGNLQLSLPGQSGKELTIDKDGTSLHGNELRDFNGKLLDKLKEKPGTDGQISDRMTDRLDNIEAKLNRTNLTGLQDAIKEIGNKIHSIKPGAAGEAERKEAKELQDMLGVLGNELSRDNVDARYDQQSGSFKITQPGKDGNNETLEIDKCGRANMSGEQLRGFLIRLRDNQHNPPTAPA